MPEIRGGGRHDCGGVGIQNRSHPRIGGSAHQILDVEVETAAKVYCRGEVHQLHGYYSQPARAPVLSVVRVDVRLPGLIRLQVYRIQRRGQSNACGMMLAAVHMYMGAYFWG